MNQEQQNKQEAKMIKKVQKKVEFPPLPKATQELPSMAHEVNKIAQMLRGAAETTEKSPRSLKDRTKLGPVES